MCAIEDEEILQALKGVSDELRRPPSSWITLFPVSDHELPTVTGK